MTRSTDEDEEAVVVIMEAIAAAAIAAASSTTLREVAQNQLTVTKLDFDALLTSSRFDGWFRDNLRCTQKSFVSICLLFRPYATTELLSGIEHSFEKKMGLTLYYLASSGSMKEAGNAMGMSKACAVKSINAMLRLICARARVFIKMPSTSSEWNCVMDGFSAVKGFPFVCGAVDGSLFEISRPAEYEGWYCKDYYPAINMQAVCDAKRRFMDYDMRPGSYSDKKTWSVSTLGLSVANIIPEGCHFIADAGYKLTCEVMTPYIPREENGELSRRQERYNYILSATRMAIECAFGMLKQRFRLIRRQFEQKTIGNCTRCILASMVLHNILIDLEDNTIDLNQREPADDIVLELNEDIDTRDISRAKRDELARLFYPR